MISGYKFLNSDNIPYSNIRENRKMNDEVASKIMKGTLNAVKYLHDKNIVHRDMKPDNILLCGRNKIEKVKICDFGLAKELDHGIEGLTYELCGTLVYKAPEQLLECSYSKVNFVMNILCRVSIYGHAVLLCLRC